jgi:phosphocarrier protein HPr
MGSPRSKIEWDKETGPLYSAGLSAVSPLVNARRLFYSRSCYFAEKTDKRMKMPDLPPLSRRVVLVNELGLHARSAAKIARTAKQACSGIRVVRGQDQADATSVLDLLTIACEKGSTLTIEVDDPLDAPVLDDLVRLVESGFGE